MSIVAISKKPGQLGGQSQSAGGARQTIAFISPGDSPEGTPDALLATGYQVEPRLADETLISDLLAGMFDAAVVNFSDAEAAEAFVVSVRAAAQGSPLAVIAIAEGSAVSRAFKAGARFAVDPGANVDLVRQTLRSAMMLTQGVRRQFARHSVNIPVEIFSEGTRASAIITDLGPGGLAVRTGELVVGEMARMKFRLPGSHRTIDVVGVARWRDGDRCGVVFRDFDVASSTELANWIARRTSGEEVSESPEPEAPVQAAPRAAEPWVQPKKRQVGDIMLGLILGFFSLMVVIFWVYMLVQK